MMRYMITLSLLLSLPFNAESQKPVAPAAQESAARLPVSRVVLYKNGVGYFEHTARVRGNQELNIDFTSAQLNDALKSLTAVDLGEGRISSVRYNSIAPLDERLKGLRLPFGQQVTRADFLAALRGARVEVRGGSATAIGRLLSVEKERRSNGKGDFYDVTEFSIVTDSGEMRNFDLGPGTAVRLAERDLSDEVGRYLNLVGTSRARDVRRMTLSASGTGERDIFVSYISEVPVWKSTYRLILPEKPNEKPLLQGWAIVDNTVGEDWKGVQLSLVAGSPQSFVQQISQPYYARRPVAELPQSVMLTPQAHEGTVEEEAGEVGHGAGGGIGSGAGAGIGPGQVPLPMGGSAPAQMFEFAGTGGGLAGTVTDPTGAAVPGAQVILRNQRTGTSQQTTTDSRGVYQFYGLPVGDYGFALSSSGFRTFTATVRVDSGRVSTLNATLSVGSTNEVVTVQAETTELSTAVGKQHIEAEGKDLGDYFEYDIKQPITIGKGQSALVPILQARVEAEKVSLWNEGSKEIRRALWLTNSSGLTLDSGTFNILDGNTFAGEGLMETIHPAERRLLSYAADPALRITLDRESTPKPATHVRIAKGIMVLTREERDSREFTVHNSDTQPRQVVIEHPAREGWKLAEGARPEEITASFLRFRVGVGPGKTEELRIEEYHPEDSQYELSELDDGQVALISQQPITPALRDVLRRVVDHKNVVSGIESQIKARKQEIDAITRDQARVRENMKALKGSAEEKALLQRYTRQLDSQEDRLNALSKEISDLEGKQLQAEAQLDQMVQQITMDENL